MKENKIDLSDITIPTYVMNLPERTDRKANIEKEFAGRPEFDLHIVPAIKCERGGDGLWKTFISIIEQVNEGDDDVVIVCEDDHSFTEHYDRNTFLQDVITASELGCHLIWGGIGTFSAVVPLTKRLFWVDYSWCAQFIVLFRSSFERILKADFEWGKDISDEFLSYIIPNKMTFYPFISIQKEFGYSDVTESNKVTGHITQLMDDTAKRLDKCMEICETFDLFCIK